MSKKLIVLFPGAGYSVDMPLLYYANFKYEVLGYEDLKISYGDYNIPKKSQDEIINNAKQAVLKQVYNFDFSAYDDIVFASKSMGTVIAGWLANELSLTVRHIFLTPLSYTLPYINRDNTIIVIAGKKDKHLASEILSEHCQKEGVNLKLFEDIGHRLEVFGNMSNNIDILKQIVELY